MKKQRVIVIGSGPAGLAAATHLLERAAGHVDVELWHMGHHLGGKAASYQDPRGRTVEHGWHMILGFYDRLRTLMRNAGIDVDQTLESMQGKAYAYESFDRRIHTIDSAKSKVGFAVDFAGYDGLPLGDRLNYGRFMSQAFEEVYAPGDLTIHDDICFRTWAIERGLRPHITKYSLFRNLREVYFNFPESISAYHVLKSMREMRDPKLAEMFVVRGGYSEKIWGPIAAHFENLGGTIKPYHMVTDWVYEGRRIVGMRVARPDGAGHGNGTRSWADAQIPDNESTIRTERNFDWIISTIPNAVFVKMNADDSRMWNSSYFRRLKNLRSGATISMTVVTRNRWLNFPGPVFGLPAPLGIAVNMKPYWDEYRDDPDIGSAVHFMGQESGFESWTDEEIVKFTLENFSSVRGIGDVESAEVTHIEIHRNRSDFERLLLCEPGVNQFRPGPLTPFHNLFLAGDWIRNDVDLICMEGAVASGEEAAEELLERMGAT